MDITAVIGFIILIILFNVVSRLLRVLLRGRGQQGAPPHGAPGPPQQRERPRIGDRREGEIVIGDRAEGARRAETARGRFGPAETIDEAASAEAERTMESWLEDIFERARESAPAPPEPPAEPLPPKVPDDMRRYVDFERGETSLEDRRRRGRMKKKAPAIAEAGAPSISAPPLGAVRSHPVYRFLRDPSSLRQAFVLTAIIGPCRARILQGARRPRIPRRPLG